MGIPLPHLRIAANYEEIVREIFGDSYVRGYISAGDSSIDFLKFSPTANCQIAFHRVGDEGKCIWVELERRIFESRNYQTAVAYLADMQQSLRPLLSRYNKKHDTRHRLRQVKSPYREPQLTLLGKEGLYRFANLANKAVLHPLDWKRYYEFVLQCRNRQRLSESYIASELVQLGFDREMASYLGDIFRRLSEFSKLQKQYF